MNPVVCLYFFIGVDVVTPTLLRIDTSEIGGIKSIFGMVCRVMMRCMNKFNITFALDTMMPDEPMYSKSDMKCSKQ